MIVLSGIFFFALGYLIPVGTLDATVAILVVTFFGLLAAGIIPAVSLLVSVQMPTVYSVARVDEVDREFGHLTRRLIKTFGLILAGTTITIAHMAGLPDGLEQAALRLLEFTGDPVVLPQSAFERLSQALVVAALMLSFDQLRVVGTAFQKVRQLQVAVAKELIAEQSERALNQRPKFRHDPGFGDRVDVQEPSD